MTLKVFLLQAALENLQLVCQADTNPEFLVAMQSASAICNNELTKLKQETYEENKSAIS